MNMQHQIPAKEDIFIVDDITIEEENFLFDDISIKEEEYSTVSKEDPVIVKKENLDVDFQAYGDFPTKLQLQNQSITHSNIKSMNVLHSNIKSKERTKNYSGNSYICEICNKSFFLKGRAIIKHLRSHSEKNLFVKYAGLPVKNFQSKNVTLLQQITAEKEDFLLFDKTVAIGDQITVEEENYESVKSKALDAHVQIDAKETCDEYVCYICYTVFNDRESLATHIQIHPKGKCELCNENFLTKWQLQDHLVTHSESSKCFRCNNCFSDKGTFISHLRTHWDKKQLACDVCTKSFCDYLQLNAHFGEHTNSDQHVCSICDTVINGQECFDIHILTHKDEKCKHCNESFPTKWQLQNHLINHAVNNLLLISTVNNFAVSEFRTVKSVKSRIRILSKASYTCEVCGEEFFVTSRAFNSHLRSHKREKNLFEKYAATKKQIKKEVVDE